MCGTECNVTACHNYICRELSCTAEATVTILTVMHLFLGTFLQISSFSPRNHFGHKFSHYMENRHVYNGVPIPLICLHQFHQLRSTKSTLSTLYAQRGRDKTTLFNILHTFSQGHLPLTNLLGNYQTLKMYVLTLI